ncbi:hypothetical protein JTE90_023839 [Oedothorax gibbosus]|uniref:Uncharacterized protein n=1 Tax=Oedothorax gibbosus TaxID=931172 RepID=A0AAV6VII8_9ARAC|nr:hypothetical protein JTE90_023839 [Oedothorax gibbosus]
MSDSSPIHVNHLQVSTEELLGNFCKLDEVPTANLLTKEVQATEDHFIATHSREDRRYTVKLPCHTSPALLGDSLQTAMRRFQSLERSPVSRPEVYERYRNFIHEHLELQHMEKVPVSEKNLNPKFYLPHHAVIRESSSTTKLRVVFDGSAKSSSAVLKNISSDCQAIDHSLPIADDKTIKVLGIVWNPEIPFSKVLAWTDSQVALSWISSEPRRLLPFFANRVAKIQEAVPDLQWNHVPGIDNPADSSTRGLQPSEFLSCDLWVQGPSFLREPSIEVFLKQSPSIQLSMRRTSRRFVLTAFFGQSIHNLTTPTIFM